MLRLGIISEQGTGENLGFVRVSFDEADMVSAWLPLPSASTKTTKAWRPIEVGSQVACLMDEECEQGAVVGALWSNDDIPPDFASESAIGIRFSDGAALYYNSETHKAIFNAPDSSLSARVKDAEIEATDDISLTCSRLEVSGNVEISGNVDVSGSVKSTGTVEGVDVTATATQVNLSSHMHPTAATGSPSPPTPGT